MSTRNWVLLDQSSNTRTDELTIEPEQSSAAKGCSVRVRTLHAGLSEGVMSIHVDNGTFSFDVIPTRGMGIWKAWFDKEEIGWQSPVQGPVHPKFVAVSEPSGLGWLDGFDEHFVRCGLESNGAPEFDSQGKLTYPLHGRIANRPAHRVEVAIDSDTGEISVTGEVDESRFHFAKLRLKSTIKTKPGELGFRVHDEIHNRSQSPAESQMLYHINFGKPFLDGGSRLVIPAKTIVPRNDHSAGAIKTWDSFAAEQPAFAEEVYFFELNAGKDNQTQVLLKNAHGTRGVSLRYDTRRLPCFSLWKNTTSVADGYVTGLEPGTNFPNPRSYEGKQNRVVKLGPGESASFDVAMQYHATSADVEKAEAAVRTLQGNVAPTIHNQPQPGWCAP